ncbi:hypothetical protein ES705_41477 [subsurface metagenome]
MLNNGIKKKVVFRGANFTLIKKIKMAKIKLIFCSNVFLIIGLSLFSQAKPDTLSFKPFVWKSETPSDCPFKQSKELKGIKFLGIKSGFFHLADTWYPTWADDDKLYSPFTDGGCPRLDGSYESSFSGGENATTGQAVIEGDDPLSINVYSLGLSRASPIPYQGRYPCGSLIYNKVWYYGTYCLDPAGYAHYGDSTVSQSMLIAPVDSTCHRRRRTCKNKGLSCMGKS